MTKEQQELVSEMMEVAKSRVVHVVPILIGIYQDVWYEKYGENMPDDIVLEIRQAYTQRLAQFEPIPVTCCI